MTERQGCAVLRDRFEAAGFSIHENYSLRALGVELVLDGFDPQRRVGYEFVASDKGDRRRLTPAVLDQLERLVPDGHLRVLFIDELDTGAQDDLAWIADRFIERLRGPAAQAR